MRDPILARTFDFQAVQAVQAVEEEKKQGKTEGYEVIGALETARISGRAGAVSGRWGRIARTEKQHTGSNPVRSHKMQERAMMLDRQMQRQGQRKGPIRRAMPVRAALEWAFGAECARLDHDEIEAVGGTGWRPYGMEYVALEHARLGTRVDTSRGRSRPHDDAELIATVVRNTLPWYAATLVADLARAGRTPDWVPDARPRLRPAEWQQNQHRAYGRASDSAELSDGWQPIPRRNRKGVIVHDRARYTPCVWAPTLAQIAAARRAYLDWWGYLLEVQAALGAADLVRICVTGDMPPMTPWG